MLEFVPPYCLQVPCFAPTGLPPFYGLNAFGFDDFDNGFDVERSVDDCTHFVRWGFGSAVGSSTTMMGACYLLSSFDRLEQNK